MEVYKGLIYQGKDYSDRLEVSNLGNFRNAKTKYVYKLHINKSGYRQCCISLGSKDKKKLFKAHKAVAETFIPNTENKSQVNHIDCNKLNNNVNNLEWVTPNENMTHASNNGLLVTYKGCDNVMSKLTEEDIHYIRLHYIPYDKEFGTRALAKKFNIHHTNISKVIRHKKYTDV